MLKIFFAFLAGLLTVGAPCVLPLLPILLGTSVGQTSRYRPLFITLGFIITFSAVALIFTLFTSFLGISQEVLRGIALVLLVVFGLLMLWPSLFEKISIYFGKYTNKANEISERSGSGNFGGFVLGIMLGIIWTPCAGPVLGSIITLIVTSQSIAKASGLLVAYAIGAGIPMLLIAYGGQYITTRVRGLAKYTRPIQQVFGVLILALAVSIYFQYDIKLQDKLARRIPGTLEIEKKLVEKYDSKHKVHDANAFQEDEEVIEDPYFDEPVDEEPAKSLPAQINFGLAQTGFLDSTQQASGTAKNYILPKHKLKPNTYALEGSWKAEPDKIVLIKGKGRIKLKLNASKINLQAKGKQNKLMIKTAEGAEKELMIDQLQEYQVYKNDDKKEMIIEIKSALPGLEVYSVTFE